MSISRSRRDFLSRRMVALEIKSQKILKKEWAAAAKQTKPNKKWRAALIGMNKADEDIERCKTLLEGGGVFNNPPESRPHVIIARNIRIAVNVIRKSMFQSQYDYWKKEDNKWEIIEAGLNGQWQSINEQIYKIQAELNQ